MNACMVWVPSFGGICGDLFPFMQARPVRRGCVHEHIRDGFACDLHIEAAGNGFCLTCFEIDGHDCPIKLVPVTEVTT